MNTRLKVAILNSVRSQIRLSSLTHIRENRISRIVQGWAIPTPGERQRIAEAVGVPEAELFDEETVREPTAAAVHGSAV